MDMRHRGGFLFRCVGDDEEYATGNKVEERTAACPRGNWSRIAADIPGIPGIPWQPSGGVQWLDFWGFSI